MTAAFARLQAFLADRYRIERELGQGGMATVYLAQDLKHGRPVAIKVLRPELAAALGPERFLREIQLTANLQHPHILPLYDSGESAGSLYYVMPLVEDESLRDRLIREKQLSLDDALAITRQVAAALGYAHQRGIIHRDIKPENILLTRGEAMVADFGIARAVSSAGGDRLTETGLAVGTPAYMSPEQGAGDSELDGRTDQYSLACVLYEMLAGEPPFTGPSPQAILAKRLTEPVPHLTTLRSVPLAVEQAVTRALARAAADRFPTIGAFAAGLSRPAEEVAASPRRLTSGKRAIRRAAVIGAVVALLVAGAIVWPHPAPIPISATRIAVLPFLPTGDDTAAARLGRDLVVTLSANLDGLGEINVVDANTILGRTASKNALSQGDGAALARKLGARSVIRGSLVRSAGKVRVELGLFDTGDLRELAHASVTAGPEDLFSLTDSLTWSLVEQIWRKGEVPSPSSLAAVTTHSVPALRDFLEGEQLLVSGQMDSAAAAYRRAFTADSTFWLAYFRYAYIFNWTERSGADSMSEIAWQHRDALPERERELLEITRQDTMSRVLARSQAFVSRYPDYWPGWFQYADYLTHNSGRLGYSKSDQLAALERTVALNPKLFFGWEHLMVVALPDNHAEASRALSEMAKLGDGAIYYEGSDYDELPGWRLLVETARTYPAFDVALTDSVAHIIAGAHGRPNWMVRRGFLIYGLPVTQIELNRRVLRLPIGQERAKDTRMNLAEAWISRGAWDSALVVLDGLAPGAPTEWGAGPALAAYRLAVYGAWLKAVDPGVAARLRGRLADALRRFPGSLVEDDLNTLTWLDGLLAEAEGDRGGVRAARKALVADTTQVARSLARALGSFDGALAGTYHQAADSMAALVRDVAEDLACCPGNFDAVNRLAATNWSLAVGDTSAALEILGDIPAIFGPQHVIFDSPMYLERGRIREGLGQKDGARHDYQQFLQRYDMPVPAHRHLVEEAHAALRRLEGHADEPSPNHR